MTKSDGHRTQPCGIWLITFVQTDLSFCTTTFLLLLLINVKGDNNWNICSESLGCKISLSTMVDNQDVLNRPKMQIYLCELRIHTI